MIQNLSIAILSIPNIKWYQKSIPLINPFSNICITAFFLALICHLNFHLHIATSAMDSSRKPKELENNR